MMKKAVIVSCLFLVAACSSTPVNDTAGGQGKNQDLWDRDAAASVPTPAPAPEPRKSDTNLPSTGSVDPWAELAAAVKSQNDEAIRAKAETILARVHGDDRALNALAMMWYRKGRFDLAAYLLGKAIQKNPNRSDLHSNLGVVDLAREERASAIRSFRRAIELNADDGIAAANLGALYVAEKDFAKAAVALEIAVRKGPRDAKTLNNLAISLASTGNAEKAQGIYEEALKENPNGRELMLNYAILLVDHLNKPKEGLEVVNRLKFLGAPSESRERLSLLENKAKTGLK